MAHIQSFDIVFVAKSWSLGYTLKKLQICLQFPFPLFCLVMISYNVIAGDTVTKVVIRLFTDQGLLGENGDHEHSY